MATTPRESPPRVDFVPWINQQVAINQQAVAEQEGLHRLYVGQTRSGKTTLDRVMLRMKKYTLALGTKPGRDGSLEKYIAEGFIRIESWPPKPKDLRERGAFDQVKLLLWPKVSAYADLKKHAQMMRTAVRDVSIEGRWTLAVDEGLWTCSRKGLDLGDDISAIAQGGGSNGISLHLVIQRPSGIPVITYASCHHFYIFKLGNTNDIRELASYGGYPVRDVATAIGNLNKGNPERGHEFLYLPVVGGASWATTEMPSSWT